MQAQEIIFQQLNKLKVIYCGWGEEWELGQLAASTVRGRYVFEYTPQALEHGIQFSPYKMPLSNQIYTGFENFQSYLPGFVADSLPDGWGWLLMDRFLRRNNVNPQRVSVLDRLAMLGANTMGALAYKPELALLSDNSQYDIQTLTQLAQQIRKEVDGHDSDALLELIRLGGSPHGARPKALVEYNPATERMATVPFKDSTPWMVKFPSAQEPAYVCALEYVYAKMAAMAAIDIPEAHYFNLGNGLAAFGVQRFDRVHGMRIPVLSMAGALHADFRMPCMDYTDILRATSMITRSSQEREIQARRMVFNILMHNRDDHVKNFAFILNKTGQWQVSPAYDLTFADGPGGEHQTSVNGLGSDITREAILKVAEAAGIVTAQMNQIIDEVATVATDFYKIATEMTEDIPANELKRVRAHIDRNLACIAA